MEEKMTIGICRLCHKEKELATAELCYRCEDLHFEAMCELADEKKRLAKEDGDEE